jgi:hypothetical protein
MADREQARTTAGQSTPERRDESEIERRGMNREERE